MKKRLNQLGFAHDLVVVGIVAVIAIAGAGYLVASHAATCQSVSGATSASTSGSCPASSPVSAQNLSAKCNITGIPASLSLNGKLYPKLTITNTGSSTISPHIVSTVYINHGPSSTLTEIAFGKIKAGASKTKSLGKYTPPAGSPVGKSNTEVYSYSDTNFANTVYFQCVSPVFSLTN